MSNPALGWPAVMKAALGLVTLALAGCAPTVEMRDGERRARLIEVVERFCAAERSEDPNDSRALFADPIARMLGALPASEPGGRQRRLTSSDPTRTCEPGRTWYHGPSRMFAEVRLGDGSDRLDLWVGEAPLIRNVLYGRPRRMGSGKASDLREALMLEFGNLFPGAAWSDP